MTDRVVQAREKLSRYMARHGKKNTRQRDAILDVFFAQDGHVSLQELQEEAQKVESSIGFATVYRTMKMLTEAGVAHERRFGEGYARYEVADLGEHHDHLICTICRHIFEFEDEVIERRQNEIAGRFGLRVLQHRHEMYGECVNPDTCERNRT